MPLLPNSIERHVLRRTVGRHGERCIAIRVRLTKVMGERSGDRVVLGGGDTGVIQRLHSSEESDTGKRRAFQRQKSLTTRRLGAHTRGTGTQLKRQRGKDTDRQDQKSM